MSRSCERFIKFCALTTPATQSFWRRSRTPWRPKLNHGTVCGARRTSKAAIRIVGFAVLIGQSANRTHPGGHTPNLLEGRRLRIGRTQALGTTIRMGPILRVHGLANRAQSNLHGVPPGNLRHDHNQPKATRRRVLRVLHLLPSPIGIPVRKRK